jgi:hypothetical protein
MSWWQKILETIEVGEELLTPGRGMEGARQKSFWVKEKNYDNLVIYSGKAHFAIEKECFDVIEIALVTRNYSLLRIASLHANEALEGSADQLIRHATNSNLSRGNYVCSILERTGLVRYIMDGNRKCIELNQ